MLQVSYIRENKEKVINGLKKRHFKELELIVHEPEDMKKVVEFMMGDANN